MPYLSYQITAQARRVAEEANRSVQEASRTLKEASEDIGYASKNTLDDLTKSAKNAAVKGGLLKVVFGNEVQESRCVRFFGIRRWEIRVIRRVYQWDCAL